MYHYYPHDKLHDGMIIRVPNSSTKQWAPPTSPRRYQGNYWARRSWGRGGATQPDTLATGPLVVDGYARRGRSGEKRGSSGLKDIKGRAVESGVLGTSCRGCRAPGSFEDVSCNSHRDLCHGWEKMSNRGTADGAPVGSATRGRTG